MSILSKREKVTIFLQGFASVWRYSALSIMPAFVVLFSEKLSNVVGSELFWRIAGAVALFFIVLSLFVRIARQRLRGGRLSD